MGRLKVIFVLLGILCSAFLANCDDYNIVEPRFYDEDDISFTVPLSQGSMLISFESPLAGFMEIFIVDSGGFIIDSLSGEFDAGGQTVTWIFPDGIDEGVYGYIIEIGGNAFSIRWFRLE